MSSGIAELIDYSWRKESNGINRDEQPKERLSLWMRNNMSQRVPHVDKNLNVSLVVFHGLQDKSKMIVGGEIIRILFEHIYHVCSLRLGQKLSRFGILGSFNDQ